MVYAQKGNKICHINEVDIRKYLDMGFGISDENGTVLYGAVPTDINTLRTAYMNHTNEITRLNEEIRVLKNELAKAQKVEEPKKKKAKTDSTPIVIEE